MEEAENNYQTYNRARANQDHKEIKALINKIEPGFDFRPYINFAAL